MNKKRFISRAGKKLNYALEVFDINLKGFVCADLGSSTGGFVDVLLQQGAIKVYAVDTAYGELDWNLRNNRKVVVLERTNALHVNLPEKVDLITIDTAWTKQSLILPKAKEMLKVNGLVVTLIKPHYEVDKRMLKKGKLEDKYIKEIVNKVKYEICKLDFIVKKIIESPIVGKKGKNKEFLAYLKLKSE